MSEPNWTEAELALHVAYEQSPVTRRQFGTFKQAMNNPAVAAALRLAGNAWLRNRERNQDHDQSKDH